jgi:hypothetical protein
MIPCPLDVRAPVCSLNLNIVFFAFGIRGTDVEPDVTPQQIFHDPLCFDTFYNNIRLIEYNPQNQLRTLNIVVKADIHENVVNQP